jgi:hypothetical protein
MCASNEPKGRRDGKVTAGDFKPLPKTATLDERAAYIREHVGAAMRCRRLELGYSWCVGVEIAKVKDLTGLTGKEWDVHCDETFGFSSRHARDFTALAKAFSTVEKMLNVVKEASFATAVVIARSLIHPESETIDPPDDTKPDGTDGPGGGPPPPPLPPPAPTPDRSREVADLVDEIQRITGQMGDQHLNLLRRVHRLLTASGKGRSESKDNAKRRKTK